MTLAENIKIDASENVGLNPSTESTVDELIERRLSRRTALAQLGVAALANVIAPSRDSAAQTAGPSSLQFREIAHTYDKTHHVAPGYEAQVLLRWGDRVVAGAPAFDASQQSAAAQEKQFGYNCDFIGFHPLPQGSTSSDRGLLCVNSEYSITSLMFAGLGGGRDANLQATREQAEVAAHGMNIVEIARDAGGRWSVVEESRLNRRLTGTTPMTVSGPVAGHAKLQTSADPSGRSVLGTLNNCAGGETPWGTVLTAEENFNGYFGGDPSKLPDAEMYKRYGVTRDSWYSWSKHFDHFNVEKEPNEPHRFGWIVEIDPYDPSWTPVKRTALGRFKHEGCHHALAWDGRVVIYSGDDERMDYVYKFVTARPWDRANRAANRDLLDEGTLYVAQFADDGAVKWLPLVHGQGPLTAENGFPGQAEVLLFARRAADLLKATPMDRPEEVEVSPTTGKVYVLLTNNTNRTAENANRANPRPRNAHGHIIEITPAGGDHASPDGRWGVFLMAGRPGMDAGAMYHRATSENGWLSCPDNCALDPAGRMWIATDGAPTAAGVADGVYAADTEGPGRALTRLFFSAPAGAEVSGITFTPDGTTLFIGVRHPGEDRGSTFENPSTRGPDFENGVPPRPSVVAITKTGGGVIGS